MRPITGGRGWPLPGAQAFHPWEEGEGERVSTDAAFRRIDAVVRTYGISLRHREQGLLLSLRMGSRYEIVIYERESD